MAMFPKLLGDLRLIRTLPTVEICLMRSVALNNDEFFSLTVDRFYHEATRRHPKFPLIRNLQYGVALSEMPASSEEYLMKIEASGRRNVKKAVRKGYTFSRINYNDWLKEIADIHRSSPVRQGPMPSNMLLKEMPPISDPPSRNACHDYVYFGISRKGKLCAYSGCMIAGELLAIGNLYGHYEHQTDGIIPLMLVKIVDYCRQHHPTVRFYMYDKYFGASETLRRFKRKFNFNPYRVTWILG